MRAARVLFFFGFVGLILVLGDAEFEAAPVDPARASVAGDLQPLPDEAWDLAKARHLLFRAGFGGPPEEVARLHAMGPKKAVEYLVDYASQPDVRVPLPGDLSSVDPEAFAKAGQKERVRLLPKADKKAVRKNIESIREWWVKRMVQSPRPLEEKMVLFWHGHFATEQRTIRNGDAMLLQNQLFRDHAAGNFGKLLQGILYDAAMLRYLDNDANVKGKPNENLAREIMELFSMGEGKGYTEQDIKEAARALTGYTFQRQTLQFRFDPSIHDTGKKTIFGQTGEWKGEDLVNLILKQPATSRFLAWKLFTYFVHEDPDEQTIEQLAKVLRDSNYELAPLLKTMFLSREFYGSRSVGTQVKSPVQVVIGSVRTLKVQEINAGVLSQAMTAMNQELFDPPNVKGWDGGRAWLNTTTLFARQNFAAALVAQGGTATAKAGKPGKPGKPTAKPSVLTSGRPLTRGQDYVALLQDQKLENSGAVVDYLARMLLAVPLTESRRAELIQHIGMLPPSAQWAAQKSEVNRKISELLTLLLTSPEYQLT